MVRAAWPKDKLEFKFFFLALCMKSLMRKGDVWRKRGTIKNLFPTRHLSLCFFSSLEKGVKYGTCCSFSLQQKVIKMSSLLLG